MHVAGSYHRLIILLSQRHNPFVHILDVLNGIDIPYPFLVNHELVVAGGLDFQIIIEIHDPGNIRIAPVVQKRTVQLASFTGASQYQPSLCASSRLFGILGLLA